MEALQQSGHKDKVKIATDPAASEFFTDDRKYDLDFKNDQPHADRIKTAAEMMEEYQSWCDTYPLVSIEDPFDQDDWEGYANMMKEIGHKIQIVGDDNLVIRILKINPGDWN